MNLLNERSNSKFVTRKWNISSDQSNANYDAGNEVICNIDVLKSNLCNYNDTYILVRDDITITRDNGTQEEFKNCAPFFKCITKTYGTTVDDIEDLNLVVPIYDLIKYSSYYSDMTGSLWFCYKDEATDFNANIANTAAFKFFVHKAKLVGETGTQPAPNVSEGILQYVRITVPLKYLSNFWRSHEMPLINCKIELKLK